MLTDFVSTWTGDSLRGQALNSPMCMWTVLGRTCSSVSMQKHTLHSLLHMQTDLDCAKNGISKCEHTLNSPLCMRMVFGRVQTGVSQHGHASHSLLQMHTNIICAQTGISKDRNTLHSLVRMHTDFGGLQNEILQHIWINIKHSFLDVRGARSCTNMRFIVGEYITESSAHHAYRWCESRKWCLLA